MPPSGTTRRPLTRTGPSATATDRPSRTPARKQPVSTRTRTFPKSRARQVAEVTLPPPVIEPGIVVGRPVPVLRDVRPKKTPRTSPAVWPAPGVHTANPPPSGAASKAGSSMSAAVDVRRCSSENVPSPAALRRT
ncbi:unannotated protein [freshwater metagenome]|uniref:Unannotated protein n=1 Tax=freshwater metagenome TaxID=449393 RepID=A0A6J7L8Y4_9ZZZZ